MNDAAGAEAGTTTGPAGTLQAHHGRVVVRMYGQGFGDCFLLAFPTAATDQNYYVLIDCGVHQSFEQGGAFMRQVAADIRSATGGKLDLVIVTHRHADHISGFTQARAIFESMTVNHLWLSWLEDPKNLPANLIWGEVENATEGIRRLVDNRADTALSALTDVLGFLPPLDPAMGAEAGPGGPGEPSAETGAGLARPDRLRDVRRLVGNNPGRVTYLQPRTRLALPAGEGLPLAGGPTVFVLGPPGDSAAIKKEDAKPGQEVYLAERAAAARVVGPRSAIETGTLLGMLDARALTPDSALFWRRNCPFGANVSIPLQDATADPWFHDHYLGGAGTEDTAERQLGGEDLLGMAARAAISLDNYVNNTSLVLAFEMPDTGAVLLFAADAQVGNWLSWPEIVMSDTNRGTVTLGDLLSRTVLYKVGHHGSINATVRARGGQPWGLELMNHADLIALLPTEHEWARRVPGWEDMPYDRLMTRLAERTRGRIIRSDAGLPAKPRNVSDETWYAFTRRVAASGAEITPPRYRPSQMALNRALKAGVRPDDERLQPYDPLPRPLYVDIAVGA